MPHASEITELVRLRAENLFRNQGLCRSEALLLVLIKDFDRNSKDRNRFCIKLTGTTAAIASEPLLAARPDLEQRVEVDYLTKRESKVTAFFRKRTNNYGNLNTGKAKKISVKIHIHAVSSLYADKRKRDII